MAKRGIAARSREHLHKVGESYAAHFGVAGQTGLAMIGAGFACIAHALVPALFPDRASAVIRRLNERMAKRHGANAPAIPPLEYEI